MKPELRLKSTKVDKTVATFLSPERLTRGAKPKGRRKIQSNPFISQIGEVKVYVNDEVNSSILFNGSDQKNRPRAVFSCFREPEPGIEPGTLSLRVIRSTN